MVKPRNGLSERHKRILQFIEEYRHQNGYSPSIREIGDAIGVASTSLVNYYLDQLEDLKYIQRDRSISRAIRVLRPLVEGNGRRGNVLPTLREDFLAFPLIGRIAAGVPLPAVPQEITEDYEMIHVATSDFPARVPRENVYALEVQGDSMIDALIYDRDIVLVEYAQDANKGDMVAVWFDDTNETTLKYYEPEYDRYGRLRSVTLRPANPTMQPIKVENRPLRIQGKVVMVIRKYR
ncbi:transcriptional repressor LexA [uncultured Thermanaerothrix sp.]|uniref:transcriptional repressor LexA n=1 Tax=uncultured Thermanaerothrix sp. TaxID=1195149 RepID=UPI00261ED8F6|nr:transcriptional repressor LexA [uncultured Thermanaerothrix sp.]